MKSEKSIAGKILSSVAVWVVVGIIGAVLIQKGWNYYKTHKNGITDKINLKSAELAKLAEESIKKVKEKSVKAVENHLPVQKKIVDKTAEKEVTGKSAEQITDPQTEEQFTKIDRRKQENVYKRLAGVADSYDDGDTDDDSVESDPVSEEEKVSVKERQKRVAERQVNLISALLDE